MDNVNSHINVKCINKTQYIWDSEKLVTYYKTSCISSLKILQFKCKQWTKITIKLYKMSFCVWN